MDIMFKTIKKSKAPDPIKTPSEEYKPFFNALENMGVDEVILAQFESIKHMQRTRSAIYHYFGKGSFSLKCCDKDNLKYIVSHMKRKNMLKSLG